MGGGARGLALGLAHLVTSSKGPSPIESSADAFRKAKECFILNPTNTYCVPSIEP